MRTWSWQLRAHIASSNRNKSLKYPKSVAFIISNEFCERFCYYGLRAILALYFTRNLGYSDDTSTELFHTFASLAYMFPIVGALIADSWLGRFKTILYLSIVYMLGNAFISIGAIPHVDMPASTFTMVGLILISVGTGGIKPCVTAFGADQYTLPEQAKQLAAYFGLFYMTINAGALISTIVTPILREDVSCFGDDTCFSLAFGVPGVLMLLSVFIFVAGKPFYRIINPTQNMLVKVSRCIWDAISTKIASRNTESAPKPHWLDYAEAKHGAKLVSDVKCLMRITFVIQATFIFWALQDQQGSRWTLQAARLDGDIFGITIKPDQMLVLNSLIVISFIPVCEMWLYPLLYRMGIQKPLQKLTMGMVLSGFAFVATGLLQMHIESFDPELPGANECQLRIFNGLNESISFQTNQPDTLTVGAFDFLELKHMAVFGEADLDYMAFSQEFGSVNGTFHLKAGRAVSYFVKAHQKRTHLVEFDDAPELPQSGSPTVRVLAYLLNDLAIEVDLKASTRDIEKTFQINDTSAQTFKVPGLYTVNVGDLYINEINIRGGAVYTLLLVEYIPGRYDTKLFSIVEPGTVHIMWQVPQYILISLGEIMFSVTGLEFTFTEAPDSMKAVLQAFWQLTVTSGNMVVVLVAYLQLFQMQSSEFFLFAALMAVNAVIFAVLAGRYSYRQLSGPAVRRGSDDTSAPAAIGVENRAFDGE